MIEKTLLLTLLLSAGSAMFLQARYHLVFLDYCKRRAKLEHREAEFLSRRGPDGQNWYVLEQWFKVRSLDYAGFGDEELNALGQRLHQLRAPCRLSLAWFVGSLLLYERLPWLQGL